MVSKQNFLFLLHILQNKGKERRKKKKEMQYRNKRRRRKWRYENKI